MIRKTDFLVVGSGIAGLTYALKVARACPDQQVLVITKTSADETNTKYAQGGIAGVTDLEHDSYEKHIEDTLIAGDGLCNPGTVEIVVKEGPERIKEMIEWGARFDKDEEGEFKRGKEGGHSEFRILHHKDVTGREMERALLSMVLSQKNIEIVKHCFVVDILTQHHLGYLVTKSTPDIECYGVYALDLRENRIVKILSRLTVFATGGNGQVYRTTTNPVIATGDGIVVDDRLRPHASHEEDRRLDSGEGLPQRLVVRPRPGHAADARQALTSPVAPAPAAVGLLLGVVQDAAPQRGHRPRRVVLDRAG